MYKENYSWEKETSKREKGKVKIIRSKIEQEQFYIHI